MLTADAQISGYSSIQQYVPYTFWHEADPGITAVLQSALKPYQHELLLSNANGIPILIQHGSADDNVPAYQARRMAQLAKEAQLHVEYHELPGRGHWFPGVMTTGPLLDFYHKHLKRLSASAYGNRSATVRKHPGPTEGSSNMNAFLRTIGPIQIRYCNYKAANLALELSRNLYQFLGADSNILDGCDAGEAAAGNMITVGTGDVCQGEDTFPIRIGQDQIEIRDRTASRIYTAGMHGLAAIFLRPLQDDRLELVVWGVDLDSLRVAARLVPLVTGAAQPHFVVTTRAGLHRGASAALAMGFFDADWSITDNSYLA